MAKRVRPGLHTFCAWERRTAELLRMPSLYWSKAVHLSLSGLQLVASEPPAGATTTANCGHHRGHCTARRDWSMYYGVRQVGNTDTHVHTNAQGGGKRGLIALISHRRSKCALALVLSPAFESRRPPRPPTRAICFALLYGAPVPAKCHAKSVRTGSRCHGV